MATNPYISQKVFSEQTLYEDLVIESIKFYGHDVYYIPRDIVELDNILNEDIESKFASAYMLEMYIESIDGFGGQGDLYSKFGIQIRDNATFVVAKKRWRELVGSSNNAVIATTPAEGDLIYYPLSKSLFEITFVDHESPFYQLSNFPTFKMECELFEYGGQEFDTGIAELDAALQEDISAEIKLIVDGTNGTNFIRGEAISQGIVLGVISKITKLNATDTELLISSWRTTDGSAAEFEAGINVVGATSSASWNVSSVENLFGDEWAKNDEFEAEGAITVEFDPTNPFGDF